MGKRSVIKYSTLFFLVMSMARVLWREMRMAKAPDSDSGKEVTTEEWIDISFAVQEEMMMNLPETLEVFFMIGPKEKEVAPSRSKPPYGKV